jgi:hypothetical protein
MFVSKQVIEKLEGEQTRLRREVKYLRIAAERGDASALRAHAEDLASRLENHASLVDAVIEAVSEDSVQPEMPSSSAAPSSSDAPLGLRVLGPEVPSD